MASVIYTGPAPERPNPFAGFGEGFSAGIVKRVEDDRRQKRREEEAARQQAEAEQQALLGRQALEYLTTPAAQPFSSVLAGAASQPLGQTSQTTPFGPALTPGATQILGQPFDAVAQPPTQQQVQQRLFTMPIEQYTALASSPWAKEAMRIAGFGPAQQQSELERLAATLPPEEQAAARQARIAKLTQGQQGGALVDLAPPGGGPRRTFRQSDPRVQQLLDAGWVSYEKPSQPLVSVNNAGETAFSKGVGKIQATRIGNYLDAGTAAGNMEQGLVQLGGLLSSGDVQTGTIQPAITALQGIASDLGVDLGARAKAVGVDIGKLSTQEELNRLSNAVAIDGFSKFKGAMSDKETKLAMAAIPGLGRDEESNRLAIASLLASARLAQERAAEAAQIGSSEQARQFEAQVARSGTQRFEQLRQEALKALPSQAGEQQTIQQPESVPPVPAGVDPEDWRYMTPQERALWKQ